MGYRSQAINFNNNLPLSISEEKLDYPKVEDITVKEDQVKILLHNIEDNAKTVSYIFRMLREENINVDLIVKASFKMGIADLAFTVEKRQFHSALNVFESILKEIGIGSLICDVKVAKLSLIGTGLRSHPEILSLLTQKLAMEKIKILLFSVSEVEISIIVEQSELRQGLEVLRKTYALED